MNYSTQKTFIVALALLILATLNSQLSTAFAQTTAFTYQGRFNTNNAPYTGSVEFQFTLWDAVSGGNAVATNNPVAVIASVTDGLFTTPLDFGSNPFNGQPRFLQIEARTGLVPFATLTPRQPLTPTPYALRALNLTTNGLTAGTYASAVTFNNAGNNFSGSFNGNGANVTNVNATTLGGLSSANFWKTNGNAGANPTNGSFLGTTDNLPLEFKVNGQRGLRIEPTVLGRPNVIGGSASNTVAAGVDGATIAGGYFNGIGTNSQYGVIGGGWNNNIAANSLYATIAGGYLNDIGTNSQYGAIGGGWNNNIAANSFTATIAGGWDNTIAANSGKAAIAGGWDNTIGTNSEFSAIGGGFDNNIAANSTAATIAGGYLNDIGAGSDYSSIGGGYDNNIPANSARATIAGGYLNNIGTNSASSVIGGGYNNNIGANSANAIIAGGLINVIGANGDYSVISGGYNNYITTSGRYAMIPGGVGNTATNFAFAAGRSAKANHTGAFVWADSQDADFASQRGDQFRVRAEGGARFDFNAGEWVDLRYQSNILTSARIINTSSGGYLSLGGTWVNASDRERKTHFTSVDPQAVLAKVAAMPLSEWSYRTEGESVRHVGPMAQDFHAAFGLGGDNKSIATVDADGVALAAIQGLNQKLSEQAAALKNKDSEIQELRLAITELQQTVRKIVNQTRE